MKCEIRREGIIKLLTESDNPVSASKLAEKFGVSRQIIVKDISHLRESGLNISSLSRGYVIEKKNPFEKVFKTIHSDEDAEKELNLIVDLGGVVEDVFIYHKVYGIVSARLDIKTRNDVAKFIADIKAGKSSLLKNVTAGYHYHTVTAKNNIALDVIEERLKKEGFLAPLQKYEPEKILK